MNRDFKEYINKLALDKEKERNEPLLKGIKDIFCTRFPEIVNGGFAIDYKVISPIEFEISIDDLLFKVKMAGLTGYGPNYTFRLHALCNNCKEEINDLYFNSIETLNAVITKEKLCFKCQTSIK